MHRLTADIDEVAYCQSGKQDKKPDLTDLLTECAADVVAMSATREES